MCAAEIGTRRKVVALCGIALCGMALCFVALSDSSASVKSTTPPVAAALRASAPKWTSDKSVEKPAGEKSMGYWKESVYTKEQQTRLGVDELGKKIAGKGHV